VFANPVLKLYGVAVRHPWIDMAGVVSQHPKLNPWDQNNSVGKGGTRRYHETSFSTLSLEKGWTNPQTQPLGPEQQRRCVPPFSTTLDPSLNPCPEVYMYSMFDKPHPETVWLSTQLTHHNLRPAADLAQQVIVEVTRTVGGSPTVGAFPGYGPTPTPTQVPLRSVIPA
jgi:hypothetical protein